MNRETKRNLSECLTHIKPYIGQECTPELYESCKGCPEFCWSEHDFASCEDKQCFKNWLAFEYLEWVNS